MLLPLPHETLAVLLVEISTVRKIRCSHKSITQDCLALLAKLNERRSPSLLLGGKRIDKPLGAIRHLLLLVELSSDLRLLFLLSITGHHELLNFRRQLLNFDFGLGYFLIRFGNSLLLRLCHFQLGSSLFDLFGVADDSVKKLPEVLALSRSFLSPLRIPFLARCVFQGMEALSHLLGSQKLRSPVRRGQSQPPLPHVIKKILVLHCLPRL
mmetsp:Transcript_21626/g.56393  ORF Transcript_21626/g.56393 Transcript_21626/m.56393 type:complete len:211 (-) Transcript_21626:170-802(-)